jgi:DNA-binding response OmpR family regulator
LTKGDIIVQLDDKKINGFAELSAYINTKRPNDVIQVSVLRDGKQKTLPVKLTKKEFEILLLLVQNKGRVFSREDILARIWSDEVYVLDRTIDVNITRLRKKIGVYGKCIVTRLGYGYCFEAE